jgi:hypothetical protein
MTTNKQALRGLKIEAPFYLAECCNCGEMYPSHKLNGGESLFAGDYADCHCPHCDVDDSEIADLGNGNETGAMVWNYQQKRIEALLDELEAADDRYSDMLRQARSFREAHDSASEIIRKLERSKPVVALPTTKLWAGKVACFEESDVLAMLTAAGITTKGE